MLGFSVSNFCGRWIKRKRKKKKKRKKRKWWLSLMYDDEVGEGH